MSNTTLERAFKKPIPLTKDQEKASDPTSSIWVGANAGTGKTHVLSARVLRMMITGTPPGNILCLTYTKAGANEMANRVAEELGHWTALSDEELTITLKARCGEVADADMLSRARTLFAEVLDLPGGLKIKTIHAFFQSLLGRFPIEATITPRFKLIEDRAKDELTQKARDGVYAKAREGRSTKLVNALSHLAVHATEQTFDGLMDSLGKEQGNLQKLMRPNHKGSMQGIIDATFKALGVSPSLTEDALLNQLVFPLGRDNGGLNEANIKHLMAGYFEGGKTDLKKAAILERVLAATPENRSALATDYFNAFLTKGGKLLASPITKPVIKKHPELEEIVIEEAARVKTLFDQVELLKVANHTKALLILAEEVLASYSHQKHLNGQLDFDDVILKSRNLLLTPNIAPWILFKLDDRLDHILVDEAQDTNLEQWQLIETLSDEFFTGEGQREATRTVFAVGDAKQSIYKFQKADPKEFIKASVRVRDKAQKAGLSFDDIPLEQSFRSTSAVLNAVDAVFAQDEVRENLTLNDAPIHHDVHRTDEGGIVELWPIEEAEPEDLPEDWESPVKQVSSLSVEARVANNIANKIESMIKKGDILESKDRPIRAGDILILVRNRQGDFIDQLVRQLKSLDIPVAGSDRLIITEDLSVMDLMAIGDFCLLPQDDLTLATLLKGPLFGLDDDQLFTLAYDREPKSLWATLREKASEAPHFEEAFRALSQWMKLVDFEGPHEFFSKILTQFGGRTKLMARLGVEISDPLDEFLSLALTYEQSHTPSLQGFLHWIRTGSAEIKRELQEARNEVRIMTTHGAKGLQAPIVFLPDCCRIPASRNSLHRIPDPSAQGDNPLPLIIWPKGTPAEVELIKNVKEASKQEEIAEYKRLMYVAMTRAEDRLYITGWKKENTKAKSWYDHIKAGLDGMGAIERLEDGEGRTLLKLISTQNKKVVKKTDEPERSTAIPELPPWALTPPAEEARPSRPLAPSRMEEEEPPAKSPLTKDDKDKDQMVLGASSPAYKRGTIIHKLLELLPELAPEKREEVAKNWLARPAMVLSENEQDDILSSTMGVLNHADFAPLFGAGSRAEVSLTGVVGTTAISGEIDRLVVLDDHVLVIDYKTNRPPPKSVQDVPHKYLKQMAAYQGLLQNIYPHHTITMALLWTEDVRLMTLDDALLSPFAPK